MNQIKVGTYFESTETGVRFEILNIRVAIDSTDISDAVQITYHDSDEKGGVYPFDMSLAEFIAGLDSGLLIIAQQ